MRTALGAHGLVAAVDLVGSRRMFLKTRPNGRSGTAGLVNVSRAIFWVN
jgi:hypothetical protein